MCGHITRTWEIEIKDRWSQNVKKASHSRKTTGPKSCLVVLQVGKQQQQQQKTKTKKTIYIGKSGQI